MSTTPTLRDAAQAALEKMKDSFRASNERESMRCEHEAMELLSAALALNPDAALTQGAGEAVEPVGVEPFGWYTSEYGDVDDIEWNSQRPTYEGDWRPLYCGVRLQQAVRHARENALAPIQQAIRDYHYALDTRQHGGIAQINAFDAICGHLDMDWEQGKEAAIRAKGTHD